MAVGVKTVLGSILEPSFSGDWDVHWGYRILTHGHLGSVGWWCIGGEFGVGRFVRCLFVFWLLHIAWCCGKLALLMPLSDILSISPTCLLPAGLLGPEASQGSMRFRCWGYLPVSPGGSFWNHPLGRVSARRLGA